MKQIICFVSQLMIFKFWRLIQTCFRKIDFININLNSLFENWTRFNFSFYIWLGISKHYSKWNIFHLSLYCLFVCLFVINFRTQGCNIAKVLDYFLNRNPIKCCPFTNLNSPTTSLWQWLCVLNKEIVFRFRLILPTDWIHTSKLSSDCQCQIVTVAYFINYFFVCCDVHWLNLKWSIGNTCGLMAHIIDLINLTISSNFDFYSRIFYVQKLCSKRKLLLLWWLLSVEHGFLTLNEYWICIDGFQCKLNSPWSSIEITKSTIRTLIDT